MPSATIIEPRETIPHYEDIRGIMDEMPGAYAASARSVRLGLLIPQSRDVWVIHYHFSKVTHGSLFSLTEPDVLLIVSADPGGLQP